MSSKILVTPASCYRVLKHVAAGSPQGVLAVSVSTSEGGARRLIDGSTSTYWESISSSKPHWIELTSEGAPQARAAASYFS